MRRAVPTVRPCAPRPARSPRCNVSVHPTLAQPRPTRLRFYSSPSQTPDLPASPSWSLAEMFGKQAEEKVAPEYLMHIARLSKLHVPEEKRDQLCQDLGKILAAVRQIQEVNTEGVAPLSSLLEDTPLKLRPDVVAPDITAEQVLRNAKDQEEGYFAVPKIREEFNQ